MTFRQIQEDAIKKYRIKLDPYCGAKMNEKENEE